MGSPGQTTLYDRIVRITHVYLGPAADRFVARQVQNHLHKPPEEITEEDLLKLIDWIKVSVSLITNDNEIIEEYTGRLRSLATREVAQPSNREDHG